MKFKLWLENTIQIPMNDLIISRRSLFGAYKDISQGKTSKTNAPVEVWKTEERKYQLTDGYHRIFVNLLFNQTAISAQVIGNGYSDYWAIARPDDRFEYIPGSPYQGLENLVDEEILEDLKKRLTK